MDINTEEKTFSKIYDTFDFFSIQEKHKLQPDIVVAHADSKKELQRLQDDLRKIGYRKQ